jgi:hypothetical protein
MGRPPKYKTAEELQKKIDEYFDTLYEGTPVTITGLILHCGFCSRQSFYRLEENETFSYTIKRARLRVTNHYESLLQGNSVAGPIFALKNLGWTDRQEIDHTSGGEKFGPLSIIVDESDTAKTLKKLRDGSKAH